MKWTTYIFPWFSTFIVNGTDRVKVSQRQLLPEVLAFVETKTVQTNLISGEIGRE